MAQRLYISIRFKILIALLLVVTIVVSVITFTMARLFHTDKTAYIRDLTSVIALHTTEEAKSYMVGYREKLEVLNRVIRDRNLSQAQKANMLKNLFEDFGEFIAVTLYEDGQEKVNLYDTKALEAVGVTKQDLSDFRAKHPLPLAQIHTDSVYVENSTLAEALPSLTLAVGDTHSDNRKPVVLTAMVRLDKLLQLAGRSRVFETFLVDANGQFLVHADRKLIAQHVKIDWIPSAASLSDKQSSGTTLEYNQAGREMIGGFAPVDFGGLLVAVQIPRSAAYLTARALLQDLFFTALALLIASVALSLFWSRRMTRPIEELSRAAAELGKGQFDIHVRPSSRDEIGVFAESFNQMASALKERELALHQAQAALIQSEKMAAFGQLGAGIAHEIKNPLAGILGYAQLSLRKLDKDSPLQNNLAIIEKETKRCKIIIDNLMKFTHQEKVSHEPSDINQIVEDAVTIVDHQLGINQVKLEKSLALDLPRLMGSGNQIQQVLMNLMINAQQAMDGKPGTVRIATRTSSAGQIEVEVSDNGPGIPKDIQAKIYEPFFTTKPTGKGTGLGLSVSYGIIKDHQGEIRLTSEPGKGACFVVTFPALAAT